MFSRAIGGFCIATVLTQLLILTVMAVRGNLSASNTTKIVGLINGIDISGDRVAESIRAAKTEPVPSFDEVLAERARLGLEMDLRRRAQENYDNQLQVVQERLRLKESRFDTRKDAFYRKLEELSQGVQDEAMKSLQNTLETLPPATSKDQIIRMLDGGDLNDVVAIVKAMQPDKRKKILKEFVTPQEADKLQQILNQIGAGEPEKTVIDKARNE
ncbi:MAG: hypothetical protein R3C05_22310 [Pirellulaceae bacterium]